MNAYDLDVDQLIRSIILQDEAEEVLYQEKRAREFCDDGDEVLEKEKYVCVSLGCNCHPAMHCKTNGLRRWSLPFDWTVTSFNGLQALISNHFLDYLNPNYLTIRMSPFKGVYNTKYSISFTHDFPVYGKPVSNYLDFLPDVAAKYKRRIDRFYNLANLAEHVYFFRTQLYEGIKLDKTKTIELKNVLAQAFPDLNFTLVVVGTSELYTYDWNLEKIKNFYVPSLTYKDHDAEWTKIFKKLGLL